MTTGDTRRMFLSSLALAAGSIAAFGKSFQNGRAAAPSSRDSLFEHIQQQMARLLQSAHSRSGFLAAEDAATAGAFMRVCAIHARGLRLDDEARQALVAHIATSGWNAIVERPPDLTAFRGVLWRKGFAISNRLVEQVAASDVATRAAALQAVQQGHSTRVCDRLAEGFELAAATLASDRRRVLRIAATDETMCSDFAQQWMPCLSIAWYIASFQESTLDAFVQAMWAGVLTWEAAYAQCC